MAFTPKGSKSGSGQTGAPSGQQAGRGSGAPRRPRTVSNAAWLAQAQMGDKGPLNNLVNAHLGLSLDPAFVGLLAFDQMLYAPVLVRPLAGGNGSAADYPRVVTDADVDQLQETLQTLGLRHVGQRTVWQAVGIVAREHCIHPLRDWLDALVWDGTLRIADWLRRGLGADDSEYHKSIGTMFLISMIARIYRPGCKADYMLVLEGPQGILKSQACAVLAGPEHFSDSLPDLGSDHVRVSMHLRGKWIVEVSELHAFHRAEASRLKQFLSSQVEQYVPKFGRAEVREPRQCVLIGTTNKDTYLQDDTGGRRFWPVKCGTIDLIWMRDNREQLLAEAIKCYRDDVHWWPERDFELKHITPVQAERYESDAWDKSVMDYLTGQIQTTLMEVAVNALGFRKDQFRRSEQLRIAAIMRQAGWHSRRGTSGTHYWER